MPGWCLGTPGKLRASGELDRGPVSWPQEAAGWPGESWGPLEARKASPPIIVILPHELCFVKALLRRTQHVPGAGAALVRGLVRAVADTWCGLTPGAV